MVRKMGAAVPPNAYPRPNNYVPFELGHLICSCSKNLFVDVEEGSSPVTKDLGLNVYVCIKCKKLPRYYMRSCQNCEKGFVRLFTHPFNCLTQQWCWDCLEASTEPHCNHAQCEKYRSEPREIPEALLVVREKPDLSKMDLPDFDW